VKPIEKYNGKSIEKSNGKSIKKHSDLFVHSSKKLKRKYEYQYRCD
jgi:hypothetical protein